MSSITVCQIPFFILHLKSRRLHRLASLRRGNVIAGPCVLTAEQRSSGVLTNVVPKEGGNSFRGEFFGNFATASMQTNNLTDDLVAKGLKAVNKREASSGTLNPVGRRPILQDKLWFFGGFRYNGAQSYLANTFINLRPSAPQYCVPAVGATRCSYGDAFHPTTLVPNSQDLNNQAVGGDTWTRGETLNLTYQASSEGTSSRPSATSTSGSWTATSAAPLNSPEAGVYFTHRPEYLLQATWSNPLTNKLLLEGGFTFYNETWIFGPEPYNINGLGPDAVVSKTESSLGISTAPRTCSRRRPTTSTTCASRRTT